MMLMTVEQIEAEALKLPEQVRAELLGRLMRSFAGTVALDEQVGEAWAQEAVRRDEEMQSGSVSGADARDVFADLRSKGK